MVWEMFKLEGMIQAQLTSRGKGESFGQDRAQMRERALRGSYMVRVLAGTSGKGRLIINRARRRVDGP